MLLHVLILQATGLIGNYGDPKTFQNHPQSQERLLAFQKSIYKNALYVHAWVCVDMCACVRIHTDNYHFHSPKNTEPVDLR